MPVKWAYGVTTCQYRLKTALLPRTLESLKKAGFDQPKLFVDGYGDLPELWKGLHYTRHVPPLGGFLNWMTAAWEMYMADPDADRYAIFEDDLLICRNTKLYLEQCQIPNGYLNLFTFATNEAMIHNRPKGWCRSDQLGKGAVALVFPNQAMTSLASQMLTYHPQIHESRKGEPFNNTDGAIQHALGRLSRRTEYVHNPSLVQHTGEQTALGNRKHPKSRSFPGESFDALTLLPQESTSEQPILTGQDSVPSPVA